MIWITNDKTKNIDFIIHYFNYYTKCGTNAHRVKY